MRTGSLAAHGGAGRALVLLATFALWGCDDTPDDAALDRMLAEARAAEEVAQRANAAEDETTTWTLTVLGETANGRPLELSYAELGRLASTQIVGRPPLEGAVSEHFAGPSLATILEAAGGADDGASEVTLVASDGFRATIELRDVLDYPIILATSREGARLARELGGPLLAAFPLDAHPHLAERYTESWWVYYVTHVVVGTERAYLRVGGRTLSAEELSALPTRTLTASVGYRVGWPSEPVQMVGPRLDAVLAAAGVELSGMTSVRVLGHAPITRAPERPTRVAAADVSGGDVIVALAYGDPPVPIPARLGGPVVLAFTDEVAARQNQHDWLTFVDELIVERPDVSAPSDVSGPAREAPAPSAGAAEPP